MTPCHLRVSRLRDALGFWVCTAANCPARQEARGSDFFRRVSRIRDAHGFRV